MLRVLIADDEPLARNELSYLLAQQQDVEVVGTAAHGKEVLQHLERMPVDLILLDIQMPGISGLNLAKYLSGFQAAPQIVFVTAHDEFALDAFDLSASDYLLKPVRRERLGQALAKVRRTLGAGRGARQPEGESRESVISVQHGAVTKVLRVAEIQYATAQGDYSQLHAGTRDYLVRIPLSTLEERWKDHEFLRIHRGYLVNMRSVQEVEFSSSGSEVRVGGVALPVSRRHTQAVRTELARMRNPEREF